MCDSKTLFQTMAMEKGKGKKKKKTNISLFFSVGYMLRDAQKSRSYRRFDLATKY